MFTAEDAQAKVIQTREATVAKEEEKRIAKEKQLEKNHQRAKEMVDETLVRALEAVEEAAGKPLSTIQFEVGHRAGLPDLCATKLVELVMEKLIELNYKVENTSSDSKESTATAHFKAHVWRYKITIFW